MALSMRLDKYLSHMGFGTRNDVKKLIKNGWVTINDETIKKADYNVKEDDRVCVDDEPVSYVEYEYYILYELEFIETRRYTINNSSLHKTHGTVNMLNLVDGKSAVIEGDFEPFIVHYAETFIIPASIKEYSIKPYGCDEVKVLKAYVRS